MPLEQAANAHDWFDTLAASNVLSGEQCRELDDHGFVVLSDVLPRDRLLAVREAYDLAAAEAEAADLAIGRTTTRVTDFVNRGAVFDELYVLPPLLDACVRIIGQPFKLSSMHARTLRPCATAQELHADVARDMDGWPLVGFIVMVDDFRPDNGATRFVPGSHRWSAKPEESLPDRTAVHDNQVLACGPAGSAIIFNGSVWHGYTANTSAADRRSIQGAFIPRHARGATDFRARMRPDTLSRISPLARYILDLE